MSGLLGGGSAKTDRGNQLAATQGEWNLFNYGLPTGQQQQRTGTQTLDTEKQYYQQLLAPGKTTVAQLAAPALNAQQSQADAERRQQASQGTGRTGGVASTQAEQSTAEQSNIDNIINATLQSGRKEAATGLESIGGTELQNALAQLGISGAAVTDILDNATVSRGQSFDIASKEGSAIGGLILAGLGL